ncbi:hypothetical protein [Sphingopyxis sp.]|uniref:hypothetical protein n=1 Tax=Sphingopyxis sp. TaxID=1908224 RepID=UPI002D767C63|nr:hypothetical protein [Sphingopyxis sp.]HET6525596.1 hypothetical protein [Sphingopyxis sp.]
MYYTRHLNLPRRAAILCLAMLMTACGSESTAASNTAQGNAAMSAAASAQPTARPQAAPAAMALPIEQGIYGDVERGSCVRARRAFFYDGTNYGYVSPAEPGWNDTAYFEINRIARVGPPARGSDFYDYYRGYTLVWTTENAGAEEDILGIKAEGNGRIRSIAVSSGPKGDMFSEETFQKCSFAQLSPRMQAAIRAERPQLAGGTAPAGSAGGSASLPVPVAPFNIRPGHYIPVGAACGTTSDMIFYYDGRRAGWIDLSPFAANRMEPVVSARRRGADWVVDAMTGETLHVQAADKITVGDPNTGVETMRWCPANEVRASARAN